jgi:hypothetical protein
MSATHLCSPQKPINKKLWRRRGYLRWWMVYSQKLYLDSQQEGKTRKSLLDLSKDGFEKCLVQVQWLAGRGNLGLPFIGFEVRSFNINFLWYGDLNSGPTPWATLPVLFVKVFSR